MSVLIIDDNIELAENIQELLEVEGVEAEIADSGKAGLARLEQRSFRLIITDMRMPNMNGLEVVREVKRRWPSIPIVVMTAYTKDELLAEAQGEGAIGIFPKPIDLQSLIGFVERIADADAPILLVEDDQDLRTNLTEIIQEIAGVVPHPVGSCEAALKLAKEISFKGAVLDVALPDGTGSELAAKLLEIAAPENFPVIYITGYAKEHRDLLAATLAAPDVHLLEKPFAPERLLELIRDVR